MIQFQDIIGKNIQITKSINLYLIISLKWKRLLSFFCMRKWYKAKIAYQNKKNNN